MKKNNKKLALRLKAISNDMKETIIKEHVNQEKMMFLSEFRKFKKLHSKKTHNESFNYCSNSDSFEKNKKQLKFSLKKYFFKHFSMLPKKAKLQKMIFSALEGSNYPIQ